MSQSNELRDIHIGLYYFQVAYLEKLRSDKLRDSCIMIQKNFRCWREHRIYVRMRKAAITVQAWVRGHQARRYEFYSIQCHGSFIVFEVLLLGDLACSQDTFRENLPFCSFLCVAN